MLRTRTETPSEIPTVPAPAVRHPISGVFVIPPPCMRLGCLRPALVRPGLPHRCERCARLEDK